jgi:hypothetical protein
MAFDAIGAVPCESAHKADVAYRTTAKLSPSVTRRLWPSPGAQNRYDNVIGDFPV